MVRELRPVRQDDGRSIVVETVGREILTIYGMIPLTNKEFALIYEHGVLAQLGER